MFTQCQHRRINSRPAPRRHRLPVAAHPIQALSILIVAIAVALGLCLNVSPVGADQPAPRGDTESFESRFHLLAQKIIETTGGQSVALGQFTPTSLSDVNFGPGIRGQLHQALNRLDNNLVADDATHVVKGDYAFAKNRSDASLPRDIKITVRVIDGEFDEELLRIPLRFNDPKVIAEVIGLTGSPGQPADAAQVESLFESSTAIVREGSRVAASPSSQVELEVLRLVASDRLSPCLVNLDAAKQPRIQLQKDDVYVIRIHNRSAEEIAATVSIDGLSSFHFCDSSARDSAGHRLFNHYLIAPKTDSDISGWFLRLEGPDNYRAFHVMGYADSAAGQLGVFPSDEIGVIHVQISKTAVAVKPPNESKSIATGLGAKLTIQQKQSDRRIEAPHEFITVRYDRSAP